MALRLMVEGRVVQQAEAYCMTDAEAARAMAAKPPPRGGVTVAFVPTRNVVAAYHQDGTLRAEQVRAAEEIAAHWFAVTRALHARCGLYAERMPRGAEAQDPPGLAARTARYTGWAEWANLQRVTPAASLVDVTLDVAVDGLSWRGVREKRGIAHQRAKRVVQASLWRYALLAGWAQQHPKAA
jgi:hypothetical protein